MAAYVVLISLLLLQVVGGDKLLRPTKRCVPTSTIVGACHLCVCYIDGIYHCREVTCQDVEVSDPTLRECEPKELYRENAIFCSCAASGHWQSNNCRERFHRLLPRNDPIKKNIRTNIACTPGILYITDCNVCLCNSSGVINFNSCTSRPCPKSLKGDYCNPGDVFRSSNEFCMCSSVNYYLDHMCLIVSDEVVQPVEPEDLARAIDIGSHTVINENECGNASLVIDCNTCTCHKNKFKCTNRSCVGKSALRNSGKSKQSMLELKNDDDKCVPGKKYKFRCNTCVCNRKGDPICTSMICLQDLVADAAALGEMIISH